MPTTKKKISQHFYDYEVGKSQMAERAGIRNKPPHWVMDNAVELATRVLDPVRAHFGIPFSPQSWYRGQELEKLLCWENGFRKWCAQYQRPWLQQSNLNIGHPLADGMGVESSWRDYYARKSHPKGEAADIEISGISNDDLYFWIRDHLAFDQLIREFPKPSEPTSGWVHVSWKGPQENRQSSFSIPHYDRYA